MSGTLPASGNATALITLTPGIYRCSFDSSEGIRRFRIFGIDENYVQNVDPEDYRRRSNNATSSETRYVWYWHSVDASDVPVSNTRYFSVQTESDWINPPDDIYYFWVDGEQGTNWSLNCQRRG